MDQTITKPKVFLGGTCAGSQWREELIPQLKIDYFNPVVPDWNEEAYQQELFERENCDICLYALTAESTSFYSIAEAVDDSNKRPEKTVFCLLNGYGGPLFTNDQLKSMKKVGAMVEKNGGTFLTNMFDLIAFLNGEFE